MSLGGDGYSDVMTQEEPNPKTEQGAAAEGDASNLEKDPSDWVTGGEAMTAAQASYLKTFCAGLLGPIAI